MASYQHLDHLGSPVAETKADGSLAWRERYTPYGEKLDNPTGNQDNQGFTGHIQDNTTGLTYMQARYYDPVTGRFLSIDPVQFSANMPFMFNRYAYVGGDPVNMVDPDGLAAVPILLRTGLSLAGRAARSSSNRSPSIIITETAASTASTKGSLSVGQYVAEQMLETSSTANNDSVTRPLGDLETIDAPGHNEPRDGLADLSDEELLDTVINPTQGDQVKVKGNEVRDGNGRIKELQGRDTIDPSTEIPVDELADDDPIAPWET